MKIKRFNSVIKESNSSEVILYRLVGVPKGEPLVINTENPGKFYFKTKNSANKNVLKNKTGDIWIMEVSTNSDNISSDSDNVIVLDNPKSSEILSIMPFK